MRRHVSLEAVRTHRSSEALRAYLTHRAGDAHLPGARGKDWHEQRDVTTYDEMLPTYLGLSFTDVLRNLPAGSRWLDYGCGDAATALHEVRSHQNYQHIQAEGVTFPLDRPNILPLSYVTRQDGRTFLRHHPERYQLITALQSLHYAPDQLATLKHIYAALAPNGLALIDMISFESMPILNKHGWRADIRTLNNMLRARGYDVTFQIDDDEDYQVVMRRSPALKRLQLPVVLTKVPSLRRFPHLGRDLPPIRYVYRLVE